MLKDYIQYLPLLSIFLIVDYGLLILLYNFINLYNIITLLLLILYKFIKKDYIIDFVIYYKVFYMAIYSIYNNPIIYLSGFITALALLSIHYTKNIEILLKLYNKMNKKKDDKLKKSDTNNKPDISGLM